MNAFEFASLLGAKQLRRGHWIARCPAHPDKHPSLSITEGRKHPVVFRCMSAGCTQDEVIRAMGLKWKDILGDRPTMTPEQSAKLRDQQTLHALRDLKRATVSPAGALLAGKQYRLDAARQSIDRRIVALENSINPKLQEIRGREAKTARFVNRWGWDLLWKTWWDKQDAKVESA